MSKSKSVPLSEPITGHHGPISSLELREPTFRDLMELGDPQDIVRTAEGHLVRSVNWPVVGEYAERCAPAGLGILLGNLCLKDALAVSEAVLDFFTEARKASSTTGKSPQSSPSTSAQTPAPSNG